MTQQNQQGPVSGATNARASQQLMGMATSRLNLLFSKDIQDKDKTKKNGAIAALSGYIAGTIFPKRATGEITAEEGVRLVNVYGNKVKLNAQDSNDLLHDMAKAMASIGKKQGRTTAESIAITKEGGRQQKQKTDLAFQMSEEKRKQQRHSMDIQKHEMGLETHEVGLQKHGMGMEKHIKAMARADLEYKKLQRDLAPKASFSAQGTGEGIKREAAETIPALQRTFASLGEAVQLADAEYYEDPKERLEVLKHKLEKWDGNIDTDLFDNAKSLEALAIAVTLYLTQKDQFGVSPHPPKQIKNAIRDLFHGSADLNAITDALVTGTTDPSPRDKLATGLKGQWVADYEEKLGQ
jgi:hypothetical protein